MRHFTDEILRQIIHEYHDAVGMGSLLYRMAIEWLSEREDRVTRARLRLGYRTDPDGDKDGVVDPTPDHGWGKGESG